MYPGSFTWESSSLLSWNWFGAGIDKIWPCLTPVVHAAFLGSKNCFLKYFARLRSELSFPYNKPVPSLYSLGFVGDWVIHCLLRYLIFSLAQPIIWVLFDLSSDTPSNVDFVLCDFALISGICVSLNYIMHLVLNNIV